MLSKSRSYKTQIAINYLKRHGCYSIIEDLKSKAEFIGCSLVDYAYLHYFIKQTKPQYYLELGSGISTQIIAKAMDDYCYDFYDGNIKLISMEESQKWWDKITESYPDRYKKFTEIIRSDGIYYEFAWLHGFVYKDIPDYPYDSVFIDGPLIANKTCGMDYLKLITTSKNPISALIDGRLLTVMAIQSMLGIKTVVRFGDFHYVKPTSKYDFFVCDQDDYKKSGGDITGHIRKIVGDNVGQRCDVAVEWNV